VTILHTGTSSLDYASKCTPATPMQLIC